MSPKPDAAPNIINQDELGFIFQDLKMSNPRIWQALTSLKAFMVPMPFYAEIILPGVQIEGENVLSHPCILRLPIDPFGKWKIESVLLQDVAIACKIKPASKDLIIDVLITRDGREHFFSLFKTTSDKAILRTNGDYWNVVGFDELATTELLENDEFRVDVVQADGTAASVSVLIRGTANLLRDKPQVG